jgi:hypothetical protein
MRHGFSIAITPFAHEREGDEDLDREPRFARDSAWQPDGKELDLCIRLCAADLAYLRALKSGDKTLAQKHLKESDRCERELTKMRGQDDKGSEEDDEESER